MLKGAGNEIRRLKRLYFTKYEHKQRLFNVNISIVLHTKYKITF